MAENQVLKSQLKEKGKRLKFTDEQRRQLVIKAKALGKRLFEVVTIVRPETILRWHKKLIAQKFDSSEVKRKVGRPKVDVEIEQFVMKCSRENKTRGYDRIAGAKHWLLCFQYDGCQYYAPEWLKSIKRKTERRYVMV
ncbi:MAG: hypothetical protein WCI51_07070 [Lentisphaerota bacterium]